MPLSRDKGQRADLSSGGVEGSQSETGLRTYSSPVLFTLRGWKCFSLCADKMAATSHMGLQGT